MGDVIWLMDSECCSECGAVLDYWENDLCHDCKQDGWWDEDQDRYDAWEDWEE